MKTNLRFNFDVNKEDHSINVVREFAAPKDKVWAAWTTPELLDQWWAPKPYRAVTKEHDLREGGHWLYAMQSAEGENQWCRADYSAVTPGESFSYTDCFCDEEGNQTESLPDGHWTVRFEAHGDHTLVHIHIAFKDQQSLEKIIEMGFKEGFSMAMDNQDDLLARA